MGSVAKRRCARGAACYQVRVLQLEEPPKLRATRQSDICEKCEEELAGGEEPPQEHKVLIETAQQLLRSGVTEEDQIVPTLVAAAWADASPAYKSLRDRVLTAGSDSSLWSEVRYRFSVCSQLAPLKIQDGILVYYRPAVGVYSVPDDTGSVVKEIRIEVHDRSVEREELEGFYSQLLSRERLSCLDGRGVFAYRFVGERRAEDGSWPPPEPAVLQILVRPEKTLTLNPSLALLARSDFNQYMGEQGKFPEPREVGAFYEMLRGLGYHPRGRGGGSSGKAHRLVLECVGCYLGGREALAETDSDQRRRLMAEMGSVVKRYITEPCGDKIPVESRRIQQRDLESVLRQVEYIEGEIQRHGAFLLNATS
jgi:hypothetical protein